MTVSERDIGKLHLYVDADIWSTFQHLVRGFSGGEDALKTIVGSATEFLADQLPDGVEAERLLDRHWIIYKGHDPESRRSVERSFFDAIADHYEVEIDAARNRTNFMRLLQYAGVAAGQRVLDFGCGPGLSVRASDGLELFGCDISPEMRRQAQARGLSVVRPDELSGLAAAFDTVVASYVLHLAVPVTDLLAAAQCARLGGRIAANFHKGRGLQAAEAALNATGVFAVLESGCLDHELHGPIRTWERIW